jgi:hypothetical protein
MRDTNSVVPVALVVVTIQNLPPAPAHAMSAKSWTGSHRRAQSLTYGSLIRITCGDSEDDPADSWIR